MPAGHGVGAELPGPHLIRVRVRVRVRLRVRVRVRVRVRLRLGLARSTPVAFGAALARGQAGLVRVLS